MIIHLIYSGQLFYSGGGGGVSESMDRPGCFLTGNSTQNVYSVKYSNANNDFIVTNVRN